jgi:hypothetical protein
MAQQQINNGADGYAVRRILNENFAELYAANHVTQQVVADMAPRVNNAETTVGVLAALVNNLIATAPLTLPPTTLPPGRHLITHARNLPVRHAAFYAYGTTQLLSWSRADGQTPAADPQNQIILYTDTDLENLEIALFF